MDELEDFWAEVSARQIALTAVVQMLIAEAQGDRPATDPDGAVERMRRRLDASEIGPAPVASTDEAINDRARRLAAEIISASRT